MIYLLLLLATLSLSTCGSSPKGGDNGPYGRIETYAGTGAVSYTHLTLPTIYSV